MLVDKTIKELSIGLRKKEFSSEDIVKECLGSIKAHDAAINSFITVADEKTVVEAAKQSDANRTDESSVLHGIPFALKDAYVTKDVITTCASNVLKGFIPPYNATVYDKLLSAGSILLGKTNMDAWGHGSTSENTDFEPVHNPWDVERSAGGSSGGCAASIASRMTPFAIGEDTGGSIRNPSAWCNTTGLKVTYGRVSRYGSIAYASSFDTVGPMGKTAEDCAYILETIAGVDPHDATSSPMPVPAYAKGLQKKIDDVTIGIPKEFFGEGLDPEIKTAIDTAVKEFEKLGVKCKPISMPMFEYGLPIYYLIGPSETSSNLARYDGIRFGNDRTHFTEETMRRIMIGTYALSAGYYDAFYHQAQKARTMFIKEYQKALKECTALIMPVMPMVATKLGELVSDPLQNLLADAYTVTQNPVGVPSLALPCGFTKSKLPIGMQIVGSMFSEELLLRIGHQYQQVTPWHTMKPPTTT
ncbi:MAG: Asp-tRNA(Asn)/Glu-tRNA(Gln) amidotransferase subunit GatA [Microgenomates group bacterium]